MIDLRLGDCLEVMKTIEDNSIDAIITDPPYGTTACKWDSVIDFDLMWEQLNRIIKPNGAIVLFGGQPFSSALIMSNPKMFKYCWTWNKKQSTGFLNAKKQPLRVIEDICVFYKKQPIYRPIMETRGKPRNKGGYGKQGGSDNYGKYHNTDAFNNTYYPTNLLEISNANQKGKQHPTQKPIALMEYLIKTYTNENETVLDFTMGSGSTMLACKNLNRNGIGIEQDQAYFNIAKQRLN
jgi:site-specific DNA-methyltransferase (adenine-specific)